MWENERVLGFKLGRKQGKGGLEVTLAKFRSGGVMRKNCGPPQKDSSTFGGKASSGQSCRRPSQI
jgi:hypothetical protein